MIKVAFDVDGTLIRKDERTGLDIPRYDMIMLMALLLTACNDVDVIVWSGSGMDYVQLQAIDKWNGALPNQFVPGSAIPFLSI